ncbi:MAG: hypothetical protein JWM27_2569 [Gemmatimonadetes bacterium]|jgi:hypothetical protein|nr:hypothetical protein [Gemmatimonadota bacterium]
MRLPHPDQSRGAAAGLVKLVGAGAMLSWFAWQLVLLNGHVPF